MKEKEKLIWIKGLQDTIQMWENVIETDVKPSLCKLCHICRSDCRECIHLSKYGQGKECTDQSSYWSAYLSYGASEFKDNGVAIRRRIGYLKSMITKIQKSSL